MTTAVNFRNAIKDYPHDGSSEEQDEFTDKIMMSMNVHLGDVDDNESKESIPDIFAVEASDESFADKVTRLSNSTKPSDRVLLRQVFRGEMIAGMLPLTRYKFIGNEKSLHRAQRLLRAGGDILELMCTASTFAEFTLQANSFIGMMNQKYPPSFNVKEAQKSKNMWEAWRMLVTWSFPEPNAILAAIKFAAGAPIVEVGSGHGFTAHVFGLAGQRVIATDSFKGYTSKKGRGFVKVYNVSNVKAVSHYNPKVLMMIWPPNDNPMARDALAAFKGDRLILGGEWRGCTGDTQFFDILDAEWTCINAIRLPGPQGIKDFMRFMTRN